MICKYIIGYLMLSQACVASDISLLSDEEKGEPSCFERLSKLFCCRKKQKIFQLHKPHQYPVLSKVPSISDEHRISILPAVADMLPEQHLQIILHRGMSRELSKKVLDERKIEKLVLQGVNPYRQLTDSKGKLLVAPLLHAITRLQSRSVDVQSTLQGINTMLCAYRQSYQKNFIENLPADKMQLSAKKMLCIEGEKRGAYFFELYGPILAEIYSMLGYDMVGARKLTYAFLKRDNDISEVIKKEQELLGLSAEDRFALACAVSEFTYALAHTLTGKIIYNIHRFVQDGVILDVKGARQDTARLSAECFFKELKPQAQQRIRLAMAHCLIF